MCFPREWHVILVGCASSSLKRRCETTTYRYNKRGRVVFPRIQNSDTFLVMAILRVRGLRCSK